MGRRGPLPNRGEPSGVTVITRSAPEVPQDAPPPPPGLLIEARRAWIAFWSSGAARWVDRAAHLSRLERWIRDVDAWHRIQRDLKPTRAAPWPAPEPPEVLSDGARAVWERCTSRGRRFANLDLLRAYCEAVDRYQQAQNVLSSTGPLAVAKNGAIARSPMHQVMLDNAMLMRQLGRELELEDESALAQRIPGVFDSSRPWLSKGSTGQINRHPLAEELDKLDARIHRAEIEFGMTPYSSVRLGLTGAAGALTAAELRRLIEERARREDDPLDEDWAQGFVPS